VNQKLVGRWGKSQSVVGAYANDIATNLAFSGYKKGEYNFKADGTYTFQGENWGGQVHNQEFGLKNEKEWGLIDEIGSYQVNGNQLIITPTKNIYRIVEENGGLKKSGSLGLESRSYTWQTYYAVGMEENRLVLSASGTNKVDGEFSTYEPAVSFPNSFCYTSNKKMFFKFQPLN
jgi:hypothetical protein